MWLLPEKRKLTHATNGEIRDAISRLIAMSTHDGGYYLLLVLSVVITSAGILINSSAVVIGGMIIAPLLIPLLACGLALLLLEWRGFRRACSILILSASIALALSACMTFLMEPGHKVQFLPETIPPHLYFLIAFASGIAGAYAFVRSSLSSSMAGVAVSVSLLPPLCAVGIGAAMRETSLVRGALAIFLLNVVGIVFAAVLVFWMLGFRHARGFEERVVERSEK